MSAIARPYAAAAFAAATADETIQDWSAMLGAAALVTEDASVKHLLRRPGIEPARLAQFYCDVLAAGLSAEQKRFLTLLADYRRLPLLPEIARLFQAKQDAYENKMTVDVVSAIPLDASYQKKLSDTLTKRLQCRIELECTVDPALMGGALVRIGDSVLDGSVRGKLTRMIEYISGKSLG